MTIFQLTVIVVFSMIAISFIALRGHALKGKKEKPESKLISYTALGGNVIIAMTLLALFLSPNKALSQAMNMPISSFTPTSSIGLGFIGAGLATGLAAIGAGIGVGISGSAGIGATSKQQDILGRTLIYVGLAEGVAIYGIIISIMILGKI